MAMISVKKKIAIVGLVAAAALAVAPRAAAAQASTPTTALADSSAAIDTTAVHPDELRGVAEHVGSGRRQPFIDTRELLAFLRADYRRLQKEVER